jgi:hypothetical protein
MKLCRNSDGAMRQPCLGYESSGSHCRGWLKENGMFAVRLVAVLCLAGSVACTSAEATLVGSLARAEVPSRIEPVTRAPLTATIELPEPVSPQAAFSSAIALYDRGEPPPSSPIVSEIYQKVCADTDRTRVRRRAYDSGDDVARRQDCYCADSMPCTVNRDCSDLVACYPQVALRTAPDRGTASF